MRLIDADALENVVQNLNITQNRCITRGEREYISRILSEFPTVDAVPVIRCRDCVHFMYEDKDSYYNTCPYMGEAQDTDYCSHGERKEE